MAQPSVYFSAGRLTMLQRNVLDAAGMERLLSTASLPEARKTLSELGWTGADITDPEQLAADRVNQAAQDARALSPDPALVDCFLYAYDAANLKMLLKARLLGLSAPALSDCGTIPADALRHAVTDHRYSTLPAAFRDAMNRLEQNIVTGIDPMSIDVAIDRAMYQLIFSRLKGTHSPVTLQYFRGHVDLLNAVALLRVRQMKKDESFFMSVLLSGGTIRAQSWRLCFAQPDMLSAMLARTARRSRKQRRMRSWTASVCLRWKRQWMTRCWSCTAHSAFKSVRNGRRRISSPCSAKPRLSA